MLESFVNLKQINERPWLFFVWAMVVTSVAILVAVQLSFYIFVQGTSINLTGMFAVLFTVIPSVFFVTVLIKREEATEEEYVKKRYHESAFWERHARDIFIFLLYFAGVTLAFAMWALILPEGTFVVQVSKICQINPGFPGCSGITGAATEIAGGASGQMGSTFAIFYNNMQVMFFSFLFAFIFGAGAVFIIVWNASILGVYIGEISSHILDIPGLSLAFIAHGVPEIAGYIAAALAGGIISVAIIRRHGSDVMSKVVFDAILVLIFAMFSILCGALIEAGGGTIYFWACLVIWWGTFLYMLLRFFLKL